MSDKQKQLCLWFAVITGIVAYALLRRPDLPVRPPDAAPVGSRLSTDAPPDRGPTRFLGVYFKRRAEGGVVVAELVAGADGERAGLLVGDVVVGVQGQTIGGQAGLVNASIKALPRGDALRLSVLRDDAIRVIDVRFTEGRYELDFARRLIRDGVAQIVSARRPDGLWPHYHDTERSSVAVSALVAYALRRAEGDAPSGLLDDVLEGVAARSNNEGLDDPGFPVRHGVYATALLLSAGSDRLPTAKRAQLIEALSAMQVTEARGVGPVDWHYGGWSYHDSFERGGLRTDVSTARYALQALADAGGLTHKTTGRRAALYLDLTQNYALLTEPSDPLYEAELRLRDGGFAFTPRVSKAGSRPLGELAQIGTSYGSATADGLIALLAVCGVDRRSSTSDSLPTDDRLRAALEWIANSYTLDRVPGFGDDPVGWGAAMRLYFVSALAEGLHRAGVWTLVGADSVAHVWSQDVVRRIGELYGRSGRRFVGDSALMHEDRPTLAACFAVIALSAARDRLTLGVGATVTVRRKASSPPPLSPAGPAPTDRSGVERGQAVFHARACLSCHEDAGSGNGPSLVGIGDVYLGKLRTEERARLRLRSFLRRPRPRVALGSESRKTYALAMPPVSPSEINESDLDDLITFLLSRGGQQPVSATD